MREMNFFGDDAVKLDILKKRAFNGRWAEVGEGVIPLTAADPDFQVDPKVIGAMRDCPRAYTHGRTRGLRRIWCSPWTALPGACM